MRISHRKLQVGVAQYFLKREYVPAIHHKMAGEGVSADMGKLAFR